MKNYYEVNSINSRRKSVMSSASEHTVDIDDEENEAPTEAEDEGGDDEGEGEEGENEENEDKEDKEKKKKIPKLKKPKGMKSKSEKVFSCNTPYKNQNIFTEPKFGFKAPKGPKAPTPPKTPGKNNMQPPARKKTMVQGMIDVALLSSNIGHLRDILDAGPEHKYYELSTYLISGSILLQMLIGVGITMLPPVKFCENMLSLMIYIVLFLNLFITAFALIKK